MSLLIDIVIWVAIACFQIWCGIQIGYNRGFVKGMEQADALWKQSLKDHFDEWKKKHEQEPKE